MNGKCTTGSLDGYIITNAHVVEGALAGADVALSDEILDRIENGELSTLEAIGSPRSAC